MLKKLIALGQWLVSLRSPQTDDQTLEDPKASGAPLEIIEEFLAAEKDEEEGEVDLVLLSEHGRLLGWLCDAGFSFRRLPKGGVDGFSRSELMAIGLNGKRLRRLLADLALVERGVSGGVEKWLNLLCLYQRNSK